MKGAKLKTKFDHHVKGVVIKQEMIINEEKNDQNCCMDSDDDDKVTLRQFIVNMNKNKVLKKKINPEKKKIKAERNSETHDDAPPSKKRVKIESNAAYVEENVSSSGTPPNDTPFKKYTDSGVVKECNNREQKPGVRRQLDFDGLVRERKDKIKWKHTWDMFADFDRRPELYLKAICALYRRQTPDEQLCKQTRHINGKGFNRDDARRASELAEFLLDGDPKSDVKKSLEEFKKFDPKGLELCKEFASHYPYQLLGICERDEDPFFP